MEKSNMSRPIVVGAIVAVFGIAASIIWYQLSVRKPALNLYAVEKGSVAEQISATGDVKAANDVDLSFQGAGRITAVNAQVGDEVTEGEVLAQIDGSAIEAQLDQAEANVTAQQAKLSELEQGARPQEIQIQETTVAAAQTSLAQAQKALIAQIQASYASDDDAIHNQADAFFNNPRSANPQLNITVNNSQLTNQLASERLGLEAALDSWQSSLVTLNALSASISSSSASSTPDLTSYDSQAEDALNQSKTFLDDLAQAVNSLIASSETPQATIDADKAAVAGARDEVIGALTAQVGAESAYSGDQSGLTLSQNQLALEQAPGGQSEDIEAQQAVVAQATAAVQNLQVALDNTAIVAPFDGKITVQNAKVGQTSVPDSPVMSLISNTQFQIETYVPENDVSKIHLDDPAQVTLDAYGDSAVFPAQVIAIDPAETVSSAGIVSYKVTLQFVQNDSRIAAGMTANIDIDSAAADNTLIVPEQSIIFENNQSYVLVAGGSVGVPASTSANITANQFALRQIQTGTEGTDGMVEVLSGLSQGDLIASFGGESAGTGVGAGADTGTSIGSDTQNATTSAR